MGTGTVNGLIDIGQLLSVGLLGACDGDAGLIAKAETALDEEEVVMDSALRRGHVASGTDTFNQVCGEMNVPIQLRPCFW